MLETLAKLVNADKLTINYTEYELRYGNPAAHRPFFPYQRLPLNLGRLSWGLLCASWHTARGVSRVLVVQSSDSLDAFSPDGAHRP